MPTSKSTRSQRDVAGAALLLVFILNVAIPANARPQQENLSAGELNRQGLILHYSAKYDEAVAIFQRAIAAKPDYAEAHYNLGNVYALRKQYPDAIGEFRTAIKYDPGLARAYNSLGTIHLNTGDRVKAVEAYREAVRVDPGGANYLYNLGTRYLETGKREAALAQYDLLKAVDPVAASKLFRLIAPPAARVYDGEMVRLNVTVTDSAGASVFGLELGELRLREDGVPQEIVFYSNDPVPVAYGLVIDHSGSNRANLQAGTELAQSVVRSSSSTDAGFVETFTGRDNIRIRQDFTADPKVLQRGLDGLVTEPGQTALIDAVLEAANHLASYRADENTYRRRVLILFSDGEDRDSYYNLDHLLETLRQLDVQVFSIGPASDRLRGFAGWDRGRALMSRLAVESGGQAIDLKKAADLERAVAQILEQVHAQHTIGCVPAIRPLAGTTRTLSVTIAPSPNGPRNAITRTGYTTAAIP